MSSTAVLRHHHSQLAKRGHVGHDGAGEHLPGRLGDVLGSGIPTRAPGLTVLDLSGLLLERSHYAH